MAIIQEKKPNNEQISKDMTLQIALNEHNERFDDELGIMQNWPNTMN